jgi:hypothetical protein
MKQIESTKEITIKSYKCTDGFVTKTITAASAQDAAEAYAIVTSIVNVVEMDADGNETGGHVTVEVSCE